MNLNYFAVNRQAKRKTSEPEVAAPPGRDVCALNIEDSRLLVLANRRFVAREGTMLEAAKSRDKPLWGLYALRGFCYSTIFGAVFFACGNMFRQAGAGAGAEWVSEASSVFPETS